MLNIARKIDFRDLPHLARYLGTHLYYIFNPMTPPSISVCEIPDSTSSPEKQRKLVTVTPLGLPSLHPRGHLSPGSNASPFNMANSKCVESPSAGRNPHLTDDCTGMSMSRTLSSQISCVQTNGSWSGLTVVASQSRYDEGKH